MSKKRAARQADAEQRNRAANPPKAKPAPARDPKPAASKPVRSREQPVPASPARAAERRIPDRPSRAPRSPASRVAIAVLLAVGLMVGFWLLFRLPGTVSHGQH